jgi:hypothetical protein
MNSQGPVPSPGSPLARLLPALGIFAGGFVHAVLTRGAFGPHDVAVRAAVTGATAGVVALGIFVVARSRRPTS